MSGAGSDIGSAMDADSNLHADKGLAAMLHATGPADGLSRELETFGQFVGSWHIDWYGSTSAQQPDAIGELHFG